MSSVKTVFRIHSFSQKVELDKAKKSASSKDTVVLQLTCISKATVQRKKLSDRVLFDMSLLFTFFVDLQIQILETGF